MIREITQEQIEFGRELLAEVVQAGRFAKRKAERFYFDLTALELEDSVKKQDTPQSRRNDSGECQTMKKDTTYRKTGNNTHESILRLYRGMSFAAHSMPKD
jgi:heme oxygenase